MSRGNEDEKTRCLRELQAPKKAKDGKKEKWTPKSITELTREEKQRLRPSPLDLELFMLHLVDFPHNLAVEDVIGDALAMALKKDNGKISGALPYCRICDLVFDNIDSFYDHIQSEEHVALKKNDSVPFFEEVGENVVLTWSQLLTREFLGPALLAIKKEDQVEKSKEEDGKENEKSGCDGERECNKGQKTMNMITSLKDPLTGEQLIWDNPADIVAYRLKLRPCAECSRIWEEYGSLITTANEDLKIEFAFRCHPIHPCVTLLSMVFECFKANLTVDSDEANDPSSSRPVKYPSREQLKELVQNLEKKITVPLELSSRHSYAVKESYHVAMHWHTDEMKAVCDRFMEGCRKRDQEGRLFYCDICRVMLPSSRHFRLHLLSEGHDKKMVKAPVRLASLYNPLSQMICFLESTSLLPRKKVNKKETKAERIERRKKERANKEIEEKKVRTAEGRKEVEVEGEEKKEEKKERKKKKPLVVRYELETKPGFTKDHRGFLFCRMGPPAADEQKKVIEVIRRERTESEKEQDKIVYKV